MEHCTNRFMRGNATHYLNGGGLLSIYQAYKLPSADKVNALNYCYNLARRCSADVNSVRIMAVNKYVFTAGFVGKHPINERDIFVYITRGHDRYIYLDELED